MSNLLGFPAHIGYPFSVGDRQCCLIADGVETLTLLTKIYHACTSSDKLTWALAVREEVRRIEVLNARGVLSLVVQRTPDPRMRRLAIWLRGRCGGYIGTAIVANFTSVPDFQTRKEAVRALKRMSGWAQLAQVASSDTSARIRRIAMPLPAKPYRNRLAKFSYNIEPIAASSVRGHLWVLPSLRLGSGKPPKSESAIRLLLERIHLLVSGQLQHLGRRSKDR